MPITSPTASGCARFGLSRWPLWTVPFDDPTSVTVHPVRLGATTAWERLTRVSSMAMVLSVARPMVVGADPDA